MGSVHPIADAFCPFCAEDDKAALEAFQKLGRFQDTLANRAVFEVKKK